MKRLVLVILLLLLPHEALAQVFALSSSQVGSEVLPAAAIDAACDSNPENVATASLTCAAFQLNTKGFTKVWLLIVYTFDSASEIQIRQDGAVDIDNNKVPDLPWGIFQRTTAGLAGAVTLEDEQGEKAVSASTASIVEYDVNAPFTRWRFTSTGGTSSDTVRVFLIKRGP